VVFFDLFFYCVFKLAFFFVLSYVIIFSFSLLVNITFFFP